MKLFISIPVSKKAANSIEKTMKKLRPKLMAHADVDFVPKADWHITLSFLGKQKENSLEDISSAIEKTIAGFKSPDIQLDKIDYAPKEDEEKNMLWLIPKRATAKYLKSIKEQLEMNLKDQGITWKESEFKYNPHITLAKFKGSEIEDLPKKLQKKVEITFRAQSMNLVHSTKGKDGHNYKTVFSMQYK